MVYNDFCIKKAEYKVVNPLAYLSAFCEFAGISRQIHDVQRIIANAEYKKANPLAYLSAFCEFAGISRQIHDVQRIIANAEYK